MSERELEVRLLAVAHTLDAHAPAFDPGALSAAPRRRVPARVVALASVVAVAGVAAAPAALSGLRHLFEVDEVPELGPVAPGVAAPFEGRPVPVDAVRTEVPFRVRLIASLGTPTAAYVRDDITGGMATITYDGGRIRLTQWRTGDVSARIAVVPVSSTAEDATVRGLSALWIAGTARGTFTLVGADGTVHREAFEVSPGALLWEDTGTAFLLQGAGTKADAIRLASDRGLEAGSR
jgi:hypothetical protein